MSATTTPAWHQVAARKRGARDKAIRQFIDAHDTVSGVTPTYLLGMQIRTDNSSDPLHDVGPCTMLDPAVVQQTILCRE